MLCSFGGQASLLTVYLCSLHYTRLDGAEHYILTLKKEGGGAAGKRSPKFNYPGFLQGSVRLHLNSNGCSSLSLLSYVRLSVFQNWIGS